jgi:hypothetical protein
VTGAVIDRLVPVGLITSSAAEGLPMGKRWWNKVTGVTKAKRKFARATGIPTTRSGRRAKVGRMAGCSVLLVGLGLSGVGLAAVVAYLAGS